MSSPRELGDPEGSELGSQSISPGAQKRNTPPQILRVRNPFERVLINRLHTPLCSPGMCKGYKKTRDGTFRWEIEQHCTLMPVDIVACSSQFEPSPDPQFDKIHEEATERYFSQEVVVPSPFVETTKKIKPLISSMGSTPIRVVDESMKIVRDSSTQTVLTLPPYLPPEVEAILESYCTYTQDQNMSSEYESDTSWLRRKLELEGHSDVHSDSEHTDEEHPTPQPQQHYESHAPVTFSPDLSHNVLSKGMTRTFGTPSNKLSDKKFGYHNKILDGVDHGEAGFSPSPISFRGTPATPASQRVYSGGETGSSLTSQPMSPVGKLLSSDDEKPIVNSPDSDEIATCLNCMSSRKDQKRRVCYCKPPGRSSLIRSASMKSPERHSRSSSLGKRSASMSSLHRSRSVQRLDFSLDMSVDGSLHHSTEDIIRCHSVLAGSDSSGSPLSKPSWQLGPPGGVAKSDLNIYKTDYREEHHHTIDQTPIKSKSKTHVLNHVISHIRSGKTARPVASPMNMSLDVSLEGNENPLNLEDKKIDFNSIDLKLLTSGSQYNVANNTNEPVSLKRFDSGYTENTTFFGKTSYYESAIKPSELTVTDFAQSSGSQASKEVSNVNWMRVDSGFKDETSSDNVQFYMEGASKEPPKFCFSEATLDGPDKENVFIEDFDKFLDRASTRREAMSISDIFADEMAMHCNFSSTPSKSKVRK